MVSGMATVKLTITLQQEQLDDIRKVVAAGQASSISGFVKHAVNVSLNDVKGWQEMMKDALDQTGGPLTKRERDWADSILGPHKRKKTPSKRKAA